MIQQANIYACSFTDPVGRAGGEGSLQPGGPFVSPLRSRGAAKLTGVHSRS
jgi:hypothetical protein